MPPKHPYTDEASKGAFLSHLDDGDDVPTATKKAKINYFTAKKIKKRADCLSNPQGGQNLVTSNG
jgi:hypothetical protein